MSSSRAGVTPESWLCVDCGADTAPDAPGLTELRRQVESLGSAEVKFHDKCEIYRIIWLTKQILNHTYRKPLRGLAGVIMWT